MAGVRAPRTDQRDLNFIKSPKGSACSRVFVVSRGCSSSFVVMFANAVAMENWKVDGVEWGW